MNADALRMLCRGRDVEANDSFQRQFSPSCNFQNVVWKFDDSARSLVRIFFFFEALVSLRIVNAALVAFSHMYRGWWASFSAHFWTSGIYFYVYHVGTATIRTIGRRVEYVHNHQNYRSKSGICCRVQASFLHVDGCCCISVHVPTSFCCCCEVQPIVLGDENCQSVFL